MGLLSITTFSLFRRQNLSCGRELRAKSTEQASWLLAQPLEVRTIAVRGRDRVYREFLITHLLADELRLYAEVLEQRVPNHVAAA